MQGNFSTHFLRVASLTTFFFLFSLSSCVRSTISLHGKEKGVSAGPWRWETHSLRAQLACSSCILLANALYQHAHLLPLVCPQQRPPACAAAGCKTAQCPWAEQLHAVRKGALWGLAQRALQEAEQGKLNSEGLGRIRVLVAEGARGLPCPSTSIASPPSAVLASPGSAGPSPSGCCFPPSSPPPPPSPSQRPAAAMSTFASTRT